MLKIDLIWYYSYYHYFKEIITGMTVYGNESLLCTLYNNDSPGSNVNKDIFHKHIQDCVC